MRWMKSGRRRTAALVTVVGLLLGAAVAVPTLRSAWAADTSTKYFGVFREATPTAIASGTTSRYGVAPASVMWFDSWATGNAFNVSEAKALWSQGIMTHFTWEPWDTSLGVGDANQIHLQDIIDGKWDSYIKARGAEFASVGAPIMVRWGHEFNGNWYPWGIINNSSDPSLYVKAYQRVHDLVVAAGGTNVQWIWAICNSPTPNTAYNDPAKSYPGDDYVDWVGIDGYNWGLAPSWDTSGNYWTPFSSMFTTAYAQARAIAPKRPVMIAEIGSSEDGGNKATWINEMSATLQTSTYADLKSVVYFDQDKEELWSGTSSAATKTAFTAWLNQSYMKGTGTELAKVAAQYKGTTSASATTTAPSTPASATTTAPSTPTSATTTAPSTPATSGGASGTCSATFTLSNSWPGGFVATVNVTAGSSVINGWKVTVTLPSGASVTNSWSSTLTGSSGTIAFANVNYNGTLPAGQSTAFGFQGTGSASGTVVTACTAS